MGNGKILQEILNSRRKDEFKMLSKKEVPLTIDNEAFKIHVIICF